MSFEIYVPETLTFHDYINIVQCARTWADGYDRKDKARLLSSLAPDITVDYTSVVPVWGQKPYTSHAFVEEWLGPIHLGLKPLGTQHFLGHPYFKSVSEKEIVVEWQQVAFHGRRKLGENYDNAMCEIVAESNGHTYMQHTFVKVDGRWKISVIRPEVIYQTGDFMDIRKQDPA